MSEVLYRKYRARNFAEMQSQDVIVNVVKEGFLSGRFAHAYLFAGPRGTGKTSMARLVAKAANCLNFHDTKDVCNDCDICRGIEAGSFIDMIEIDAASNRGIDEIRQIKENVNFSPSIGKHKVYIIDEVHMLTREAFNALLKTLEEPPTHVIFILATTEPHKVPATILSRVQRFDFRLATFDEMYIKLQRILDTEKIQIDKPGIELIYKHSGGSYRDAESLLGKVVSTSTGKKQLTSEDIASLLGIADVQIISDLCEQLLEGHADKALALVDSSEADGVDLSQLSKQLIEFLREGIRVKVSAGQDTSRELKVLTKIVGAYSEFRHVDNPKLLLEIAALELAQKPASKPLNQSQPQVIVEKAVQPEKRVVEEPAEQAVTEQSQTEPDVKSDISETDRSERWKMLVKKAKTIDFKLMALLRGCDISLTADKAILTTSFRSAATDLEENQETFKLIQEFFPAAQTLEIVVTGEGNGTMIEEEQTQSSNADLVESIF